MVDIEREPKQGDVWDQLKLGPNTTLFLRRMYAAGLDKYVGRLTGLGFGGGKRALDAGCGLGQWSFALARLCDEVHGVDLSSERVEACTKIGKALKVSNAQFLVSPLEKLPYPDEFFDRVICYSVLYLTDYEKALREIARVTSRSGLAYISTNGVGRFVYDILKRPNPAPDFDPRKYGVLSLWNTITLKRSDLSPRTGGVVTGRRRVTNLLKQYGFDILDAGSEGRLRGGRESFLPGRFLGLTSTFDILARKA